MSQVSVIIPYYQKKKYILRTLRSVITQSYRNLEIIIAFDEESKRNLEFINKLVKLDNRIKLIINKKNFGAGYSRNIAIKKSKGKFIAFIDADDLWHKKKIQKQIRFLKKNNYKICHTSYDIIDKKNSIIGFRKARDFLNLEDLIKSCDIGLSTVMCKKEIFNRKNKFAKIKTKEDFVLWLRLLRNKIKIYAIDDNLAKWRKTNNALSSSITQKLIDGFRVYNVYLGLNILLSIYYLFRLSINYIFKRIDD